MKSRRLLGSILMVTAAACFIFSLVGLYIVWHYRPVVTKTAVDSLSLYDQSLTTTQDGLNIIGQEVQATTTDVSSLQTTTQALAKTIQDTNPMIDSLTILTSKDFPAAINATQASLTSAQSSALLIDNTLGALTSIPLLPLAPYKPAVPLHTALAQVSASLDSITPALATITSSLVDSKTNLGVVEVELNKISDTTQGISAALGSAQTVIDQYKTITTQLKDRVETTQRAVPGWITAITWILSFVLVWVLVAQVGQWFQGLEMVQDINRSNYPVPIPHG